MKKIFNVDSIFENDFKKPFIEDKNILLKGYENSGLTFKNRFYFENLCDDEFFGKNSEIFDKFSKFYGKIAHSGVGLISTGTNTKCELKTAIKEKNQINIFKQLINKFHSCGAKIIFKISTNFGRLKEKKNIFGFKFSTNSRCDPLNTQSFCTRISDRMIKIIIKQSIEETVVSNEIGFDGILLDFSADSIFGELISKEFNTRIFGYYLNSFDLIKEIVPKIVKNAKNNFVLCKITLTLFLKETFENDLNKIESLKETKKFDGLNDVLNKIKLLVDCGVSGFIFDVGTYENKFLETIYEFGDDEEIDDLIKTVIMFAKTSNLKNKFGDDIFFVCQKKYNFSKGKSILNINDFDFFDVTKSVLADNDYIFKLFEKQKFNPCIDCEICEEKSKSGCLSCCVNPSLNNFDEEVKAYQLKKIAVVGSGISGMISAIELAKKGHSVDLFESRENLNFYGNLANIYGFDEKNYKFCDFLENKIVELASKSKINLFLKTKFIAEKSMFEKYDSIIVATGFHELVLNVSGAILQNVKSIYEVLSKKEIFENHKKIAILAKGELSLKLAIYLLKQNKNVTLIFENIEELKKIPNSITELYFYNFSKSKTKIYFNSKVKRIENEFVEVVTNKNFINVSSLALFESLKMNKIYSEKLILKSEDMDLFVYEPDIKPNNKLFYEIVSNGFLGEVFMVGNALTKMNLDEVISSAYFVAKNI